MSIELISPHGWLSETDEYSLVTPFGLINETVSTEAAFVCSYAWVI